MCCAFALLRKTPISPEAVALVSEAVAGLSSYSLRFDRRKNELAVAMANPDLEAIEFWRKDGSKVIPYLAEEGEIEAAIKERYGGTLVAEVSQAMEEELAVPKSQAIDIRQLGTVIREAPIAKVVSTILEFAVSSRASDVHIEPQPENTRVRYRIDGVLHEKLLLPKTIHEALISRIKILSGMKIDEKRIPQDGRFKFKAGEMEVDLRVSSAPTIWGKR